VVDENAPHDACGQRKKVCTVLEADLLDVDQTQVRFADECGGLKALSRAFTGRAPPRDLMELPVDKRNQAIQSRRVTIPPGEE